MLRIVSGNKVIYQQPSCLVKQQVSGHVVAVGQNAAQMIGKTPQMIDVIWPIRQGKIIDLTAFQQLMITALQIGGVTSSTVVPFFQFPARFIIPAVTTSVQREAIQAVLRSLQLKVQFMTKLEAIAKNRGFQAAVCVVDIGGMTTECGVIGDGQPVTQQTVAVGSEELTQEVLRCVRQSCQAEIGWLTAEQIKREVVRVLHDPAAVVAPHRIVVRGRDILTNLPKTFQVSSELFDEVARVWLQRILKGLHQVLQDTPSEILTEALSNGIFLTGGGSLVQGLSEAFHQHFQTEIIHSKHPFTDTVKGG